MTSGQLRRAAARLSFKWPLPGSAAIPGERRTDLRGHGLDFVGYREYQYGDDVRTIDWNVAARQGRPVVKVFEQGFASALTLVLDASASMQVDGGGKWAAAREVAAVLAFMAAQESDLVGAVIVTAAAEAEFPLRRGLAHASALVHGLDTVRRVGHGTNLAAGIDRGLRLLPRSGALVIVSDFLTDTWEPAVRKATRRHQVIGIHIVAPREMTLPDAGVVHVVDAETRQAQWLDTSDARVRAAFAARAVAARRAIGARLREAGAVAVVIDSGQPLVPQLGAICDVRHG